jgi:hypothetical protein
MKKLITLFAIAGMVLALAPAAQAISWDGGGGDGLWSTVANWNPDTVIAGYTGDFTGTFDHSSETTVVGTLKVRSTSTLLVSGGSLTAAGVTLDKNAGNLLEVSGGTLIVTGLLGASVGDDSPFTVRQTGSVGSMSMGTLGIRTAANATLDLVMDASGISALTLDNANTTKNFGNLTIDTSAYTGPGGAITIMNIGDGTGTQAAFASVLVDGLGTGFTIAYDGGDGNDVVLTLPGGSTPVPGTLIYGK